MEPLVLYHIPDPEKAKLITDLCRSLHFKTKPVTPQDSGKTVGALCGIPAKTAAPLALQPELPELLIFSGLQSEGLDLFLAAYRKAGIPPVALKAVVTPHNKDWTLSALAAELQQERAAMLIKRSSST